MNNKWLLSIVIVLFIGTSFACNPYKGFKGVNPKGMQKNKAPSQRIDEDYKKQEKKMKRRYDREMKKRKKKMGN